MDDATLNYYAPQLIAITRAIAFRRLIKGRRSASCLSKLAHPKMGGLPLVSFETQPKEVYSQKSPMWFQQIAQVESHPILEHSAALERIATEDVLRGCRDAVGNGLWVALSPYIVCVPSWLEHRPLLAHTISAACLVTALKIAKVKRGFWRVVRYLSLFCLFVHCCVVGWERFEPSGVLF